MLCRHRSCPCGAFGAFSPWKRSSFCAWLRAEAGADSLPPLDEFMGCDIISRGSLCSEERRSLIYLLMKRFIRWSWSHRALPGLPRTRVCGGGRAPGRCPAGGCHQGWQSSVPAWGWAAEGLSPPYSPHTVLGAGCVCTRVSRCRWEVPVARAACAACVCLRCLRLRPPPRRCRPHGSGMRRVPAAGLPWAGEAAAGASASLPRCWKRPGSALAWGGTRITLVQYAQGWRTATPPVWKRAVWGFWV